MGIGDHPMSMHQLHRLVALILDLDGVDEEPLPARRIRAFRRKALFDRNLHAAGGCNGDHDFTPDISRSGGAAISLQAGAKQRSQGTNAYQPTRAGRRPAETVLGNELGAPMRTPALLTAIVALLQWACD